MLFIVAYDALSYQSLFCVFSFFLWLNAPMQTFTIIVVAYNEAYNIPRLKQSIDSLSIPNGIQLETILVNNGSTDDTARLAEDCGFRKVLNCPGINIPQCRNCGVRAASGSWIIFTDADCEFAHDWLIVAYPFLSDSQTDILGGLTKLPPVTTWVQRAWQLHWQNKNTTHEDYLGLRVIRHESFRMITTKNMAIRKQVLLDLGGFDETLSTGEDTNLLFRAHLANTPMISVPALKIIHYGEPATLKAFFRQQLWHANRGSYKHILTNIVHRKGGAHAPLFTLVYLFFLLLAFASIALALIYYPVNIIGSLPFVMLLLLLAARTCGPTKSTDKLMPLFILYFLYGLARSLDLIGLNPVKRAWKSYQ